MVLKVANCRNCYSEIDGVIVSRNQPTNQNNAIFKLIANEVDRYRPRGHFQICCPRNDARVPTSFLPSVICFITWWVPTDNISFVSL